MALTQTRLTFKREPKGDGYLLRTAGFLFPWMHVDLQTRCGDIEDGVGLALYACEEPNQCQWAPGGVIAFRDLEALYFAAKAARGQ